MLLNFVMNVNQRMIKLILRVNQIFLTSVYKRSVLMESCKINSNEPSLTHSKNNVKKIFPQMRTTF